MVSLSTAESELYAAVKTASGGLGIQSLANDLGMVCKLNFALGCVSNDVPGEPQEMGQSETRERATLVDTRGVQENGRNRNMGIQLPEQWKSN